MAAYNQAQAGGLSAQLDFLACVAGGDDATEFSRLFGSLAELALLTSGVDPDEYWSAVGTNLGPLQAAERSPDRRPGRRPRTA